MVKDICKRFKKQELNSVIIINNTEENNEKKIVKEFKPKKIKKNLKNN